MSFIELGIEKGLISFDSEKKYITYTFQNKKRNWSNPEEQVQTETFCFANYRTQDHGWRFKLINRASLVEHYSEILSMEV